MEEWRKIRRIEGRTRYEDIDHMQCRACGYYTTFQPDGSPGETLKLDGSCAWLELLNYLGPTDVKWNPSNGEVILVYPDGTETSMYTREGISMVDTEGKLFFRCALPDSEKICMEAPDDEQT